MGKRKIIEAANKKRLTVESAEWGDVVFDGMLRKSWLITFGAEVDELYGKYEDQCFSHTAEALEWINSLEPLPPREEE